MAINAKTIVVGGKQFVRVAPQEQVAVTKVKEEPVAVVKESSPAASDIIVKKHSTFHRDMLDDNN